MLNPQFAMIMITLVLALGAGHRRANAQAPSDSIAIAVNAKVRVNARFLGTGWHEGTLARISLSSGDECFGFAPTARTDIGAVTIDGTDSLEVWVPGTQPRSAIPQRDTVRTPGKWIGVPRTRIQSLSKGCGPRRP